MAALAAICGVMIVLCGLILAGPAPTEIRFAVEMTCFVGGLVLCFLAVVLARLGALARKLDAAGRIEEPSPIKSKPGKARG